MSFTQSTFTPLGGQSTLAPALYSYRTDDLISEVTSPSYFKDKKGTLEPGDPILVSTGLESTTIIVQQDSETAIESSLSNLKIQDLLIGVDTTEQIPSGLDDTKQVTFGGAQGDGNSIVQVDALGNITYNIDVNTASEIVLFTFSRSGASGVSVIYARRTVNGIPESAPLLVELDNANTTLTSSQTVLRNMKAGDVVTYEFVRDPSGNNSGQLKQSTPTATGWDDSTPSAAIFIRRFN